MPLPDLGVLREALSRNRRAAVTVADAGVPIADNTGAARKSASSGELRAKAFCASPREADFAKKSPLLSKAYSRRQVTVQTCTASAKFGPAN